VLKTRIVQNYYWRSLEVQVGCSERRKEIKRRRKRRAKVTKLKGKIEKASVSEKTVIAEKLRDMTPGADVLIARYALEDR
jgi:hypothetical protein